jgi:hypothetical protein
MGSGASFCMAICKALSTCAAASSCMPGITWLYIERNTDLAVAKPLTGDLRMDARRQHVRGMSMTQIVALKIRQSICGRKDPIRKTTNTAPIKM